MIYGVSIYHFVFVLLFKFLKSDSVCLIVCFNQEISTKSP
jgi:hypothetical protein